MRSHVLLFALLLGTGAEAFASGHGPVFGFATPVNSQGEWSFDAGMFGRNATFGSQLTARTMASYGFTPHLQFSLIAPALAQQGSLPMTMMSGGGEFQTNLAWRFHHQPNAIGSRFESTASVGLVVPGPQDNFGNVSRHAFGAGRKQLDCYRRRLAQSLPVDRRWAYAIRGIAGRSPPERVLNQLRLWVPATCLAQRSAVGLAFVGRV